MRPANLGRRALPALALAALLAALAVTPAVAKQPGPTGLPALTGSVVDGCTGLPVNAISVTVTASDGSVQHPPNPNLGVFVFASLPAGPAQLVVSAPGYLALGASPTGAPGSGATITIQPGPVGYADGGAFATGLLLSVQLMPLTTPATGCKPPNPNLPAIAGYGADAATGLPLAGLAVGLAPVVLDPTTGLTSLGSIVAPSSGPLFGLFVFRNPGPVGDGFQFYGAAPGYTSLGADPAKPPSPNTLGPGVLVGKDPGPTGLPAGTGAVYQSLLISFALPAGPAGG